MSFEVKLPKEDIFVAGQKITCYILSMQKCSFGRHSFSQNKYKNWTYVFFLMKLPYLFLAYILRGKV